MKTVAVYNFKGGAGKTTVTHTLACGLALRGKRILVIDSDPQGHASLLFDIAPQPGFYDYLARADRVQFGDVAIEIPRSQYASDNAPDNAGYIALIPGNDETSVLPLRVNDPRLLRRRLDVLATHFDVCLIDTPPTPSLLSVVIYTAIDGVLYPTKCENLHVDGLTRALNARWDATDYRATMNLPEIQVFGIQPAIYRAKTLEHAEYFSWLIGQYGAGMVWEPLSESILWAEAARRRKPIFTYAPRSKAAKEAWAMTRRFSQQVSA